MSARTQRLAKLAMHIVVLQKESSPASLASQGRFAQQAGQ
jgi:hypothetical protein